jgi:phage tail protein X
MASFNDIAQKKVAGVPVLYLAGAFVAILAIVAWKMKPSSGQDLGPVDETDGTGSDETGGAADYSGLNTQGTVTVVQGTQTETEAVKPTNEDWERSAVEFLVDSGLATPSEAQAAIHLYLEGGDLSYAQGQLKDAAIRKLKLPPEPLVTIGSIGTSPAQKQFNQFPGKHTVKGTNDNTPTKLAVLYYGNGTADRAGKIVSANPGLGPVGTTYTAGAVITIPEWVPPRYFVTTKYTTRASQVAAKNGTTTGAIRALNPTAVEPYPVGKRMRVS